MTGLKQSINKKVPLNRAIISDILLWVALAGALIYGAYALVIVIPARRGQTITLDFYNANEISRGAPVRLMGTDIGFVDDIQLKEDHVEVTVQTDPDALQIPSGSVFTILFTGLGGAKSIEVSLPPEPLPEVDGKPVYRVQEPISMRDTLNASLDSVQALQKGSENISDFFGKRKPVEELQFNIRQAHEMSGVAARNTAALNRGLEDLRQNVSTYMTMGMDTMQDFNHGATIMNRATEPAKLRKQIHAVSHNVRSFEQTFFGQGGMAVQLPTRLSQFNQSNNRINLKLVTLNQKIAGMPIPQWLDDFEKGQDTFQATLTKMDNFFDKDPLMTMQQWRPKIRNFNRQVLIWTDKAEQWEAEGIITPPPEYRNTKPSAHQGSPRVEQSIAIVDQFGNPIEEPGSIWWHQEKTTSRTVGFHSRSHVSRHQQNIHSVEPEVETHEILKPLISLIQPIWNALCYLFA